jgi:GT2 family glycosyltransferase
MTAPSTPLAAESPSDQEFPGAPRVRVLLTVVEGADLAAALAVVQRQVYEPAPEVVIVGASGETPEGYLTAPNLEKAIADADERTDYLWLLHSDARPRPDALGALVAEVSRNEAALGGSKLLVAGTRDELESVGSATDVFGEPYSGLETGEIDLQQYDVVREVAFVRSASMLVRRDLAQGLRGLDVLLPPIAAGLDFSQRTRLAGGKVISVPSSEVFHQGHCNDGVGGWREQAGRMRAMLTAYRFLTLVWVVPYDLLVSVVDSLANLLLLRWRPAARHLVSWLWNIYHLPSTIGLRWRFRAVRAAGDEELFRFQARGSVRLREIGSEVSSRVLSTFDDDQALTRRTRGIWASPGIWGALLASAIALVSARSLIFIGMPDVGFAFPFEELGTSFDRWLSGWNDSGLGSGAAVHPLVLVTSAMSAAFFGVTGAARTVSTIALAVIGIAGMGRLGGRFGLRGPGRYLAGLALLAGPGTAVLTGRGSWAALVAAAALPWAIRAVLPGPEERGLAARQGWAFLLNVPVAAAAPVLGIVPALFAVASVKVGERRRRLMLGAASLLAVVVAIPFLLGDNGWLVDDTRRLGVVVDGLWPVLIGVATLPLLLLGSSWVGLSGGLVSVASLTVAKTGVGGPGLEEALLVLSSLGAALVVATGGDRFGRDPRRLMAVIASLAIVGLSLGTFGNGRYGLADGEVTERLGFAPALAGPSGPGRILIASTDRDDVPGEARPGPGFWYRVVDAALITMDEVWLPAPLPGDEHLGAALTSIGGGGELRPGQILASFGVDWVVLLGPTFRLDEVLVTQLDMVPTPLDPESRVFENLVEAPLADAGDVVWTRDGTGFGGAAALSRVRLAMNYDPGWDPEPRTSDWAVEVAGGTGQAAFRSEDPLGFLTLFTLVMCASTVLLILRGRVRR